MQTNIKQIQPAEYEMQITASPEDLGPKIDEALRAQRTRTTMKGFRPGKVPMSLVRKMYGRALAYEIAEKSIQETYEKEVVNSEAYDVLGAPKLTELEFEDLDGEMRAVVRFGVRPEFELKDYSQEKVTRLVHEVSDKDVDEEIERLLKRHSTLEPLEDDVTATEESHAKIDLQRLDDATGTPIIGEREEGVTFFLSDPRLKEPLRDALKGRRVGETFRVDLPHEHDHDHDHEEADAAKSELLHLPEGDKPKHDHTHAYEVSVRELKRQVMPELTEEFIREATNGEAEDEQGLRTFVSKLLSSAWDRRSREYLHDRIVDRLISLHEIAIPESLVDVYLDSFIEDVRNRNEGKLPAGFNEEHFREANRDDARRQAHWALIRDRIIDSAGLEVTDEDRERYFEEAATDGEVTAEALAQFYRSMPRLIEQLDQQLLSKKVFDHLESSLQIEEKDRESLEAELKERA